MCDTFVVLWVRESYEGRRKHGRPHFNRVSHRIVKSVRKCDGWPILMEVLAEILLERLASGEFTIELMRKDL